LATPKRALCPGPAPAKALLLGASICRNAAQEKGQEGRAAVHGAPASGNHRRATRARPFRRKREKGQGTPRFLDVEFWTKGGAPGNRPRVSDRTMVGNCHHAACRRKEAARNNATAMVPESDGRGHANHAPAPSLAAAHPGLDVRKSSPPCGGEKSFLLTSPFIEPRGF
jgi:hypothetical protein